MSVTRALGTMNITELRGRPVLASDTAQKIGEVADLLLHLGSGRVTGLLLRMPSGELSLLETRNFLIGDDAVMAAPGSRTRAFDVDTITPDTALANKLVGATVVTEDGKALGRLSEVYVSTDRPQAAFRVAANTFQTILGGGFFLSCAVVRALSADGSRMLVPSDTMERHAASSLSDAL